jgi:hypothetical protein
MKVEVNGKNMTVSEAEVKRLMATLDLSEDEAVELFLADAGLVENEEVAEMTAKAKAAGTGAKATGERKERKAPERKPDMVKRAIITSLADFIEQEIEMKDAEINHPHIPAEITNPERMIAFSYGGEKFELTLTKKRAPKK